MNRDDAEEFTQALGQVVAGSWRQIALAKRIGVPKALGLTTEQWVNDRLGGYVQMSIADRQQAAGELSRSGHGVREIGSILGVSKSQAAEDVQNWTAIDAVAVLAADEAVQKQIASEAEKAAKAAAREAARGASQIDDGCTVEDLNVLIATGKKFSVIYADPPWEFKVYSGKGKQRSAERHYDTASLDDIKALPIGNLAGVDCALFMWCVMPELPGALDVIRAWGFEYKTVAFVWVKTNENDKFVDIKGAGLHWGMGYWTRANTELCLFATKGSPQRIDKGIHQVVVSPVGEHSRKPDEVQVRIEKLLAPEPSRETHLELFGRRASPRWTVWGNQVSRSLFHQGIPEFGGLSAVS